MKLVYLCGILAGLVVFAGVEARAEAQPAKFPARLVAGRSTLYDEDVKAAIENGLAKVVEDGRNQKVVETVWIEHYQGSDVTTSEQVTYFVSVRTTYQLGMFRGGNHFVASEVKGVMLVLNFKGQSTSAKSWVLTYKSERDPNDASRLRWTSELTEGRNAQAAHNGLSDWAKSQLWWLSGFLDQNNGLDPVAWYPTDAELAASILTAALVAAPSVVTNVADSEVWSWLLGGIENVVRAVAPDQVAALFADDRLRFGGDNRITNERAVQHRETYVPIGKRMWGG